MPFKITLAESCMALAERIKDYRGDSAAPNIIFATTNFLLSTKAGLDTQKVGKLTQLTYKQSKLNGQLLDLEAAHNFGKQTRGREVVW